MDRISGGFMFSTFVMRPCIIRKWGLFTLSCTEWKRVCTREGCARWPLIRYLFRPPTTIWRVTVISGLSS
uniref:Uncharacterized protein n=1 Tax=Arundo donax TaxID=35708 RepID=A0A0A9FRL8_ARUDO